MDSSIAPDTELGLGNTVIADMVDASHDATKLPRALVAGGVGEATLALYLALFRAPASLFLRTKPLLYAYYGALVAVVLFGLAEAWAGFWVSRDAHRRRAVGMTALWVSVLPVLFLACVGGHAILIK
ncbi:hypothetical protein BRADI_5g20006v3 [Brachypodium distachyon]|uniref:Uncharacterized protein n=1 Tax=Brachypodium distachyon TaxID=15368 RepID=I1J167_BRADI|nr:hypothetical protein BRADI_5g20006v3 [Brachypodium distachyon]